MQEIPRSKFITFAPMLTVLFFLAYAELYFLVQLPDDNHAFLLRALGVLYFIAVAAILYTGERFLRECGAVSLEQISSEFYKRISVILGVLNFWVLLFALMADLNIFDSMSLIILCVLIVVAYPEVRLYLFRKFELKKYEHQQQINKKSSSDTYVSGAGSFLQPLVYVVIFLTSLVVVPIYLDLLMGRMFRGFGFSGILLNPILTAFSFLIFAWYMSERNEAKETGKSVRWWDQLLGILFGVIPVIYMMYSLCWWIIDLI